ncbi:zinc-dependent alcohol dehydrogenase [Cytobacillus purgationiresistens]|uniref:L-iditol 2-dehydrogenase n=1 Tax=Cytobacillus purgationiresistens TaxID=863449 RepID=A0ABU0APC7_9BACI|nr:alcohol dehydrogenase catalytic domain-containing protein [Cytobacillus purgationiresistens]MDQ0273148.1 L-iditol 2-dehydrogenase [Cytobacillus purgationiresistens]
MKAIVKSKRGQGVEVREVSAPVLHEDDVMVRVEAASICGSDLHMYEGMDAYEWVSTPVTLGHEFAGTVVKVNKQDHEHLLNKTVVINPYIPCGHCHNCQKGNTNLCDHGEGGMAKVPAKSLRYGFRENGGMAEYAAIHFRNVLPIPETVPIEVAGMLEAIGIGVRAIERAEILPGDTAVVIGPGPIGLSMIASLSNYGCERLIVTGLTKDEGRLQLAMELGATDVIYADQVNAIEAIAQLTNGNGVDHVFETSGFHESLTDGVRMCTKGGEILLVGISSKESILPTNEIVRGEITVKGVYGVTEKTMKRAISMAASGKYPYEKLVSHVFPLDEAVKGFEAGLAKEAIKVILKP